MAKTTKQRSFDDVMAALGSRRFDVAPAQEGASRGAGAFRVGKYGCAAEIGPGPGEVVEIYARSGWLIGGEISRLLDRGYQKFLKTTRLEVPATAEHLRSIHQFSEELKETIGAEMLYNEALGTTSDRYLYDRVKGRE